MFPSGWKSILRPIRDGYRHLFPSPDTGPTPEERRKQRELDKLKGFTYFDTFDELYSWTKDDASPFQRANTPLLPRPPLTEYDVSEHTTAPVLLVHDYAGNYHDYEASQGAGISQTLYSCEYLQFVDVFVYFSHKLVCVPPPAWTNALHRNGVKVLGTLLIEPQTRDAERLLEHQNEGFDLGSPGGFPVARRLADMAECYGFDGWLVNVERAFERGKGEVLVQFLSELKKRLREGKMLIWLVLYFIKFLRVFLVPGPFCLFPHCRMSILFLCENLGFKGSHDALTVIPIGFYDIYSSDSGII